ncbi:hypothetical protein FQA39_LY04259 [Lamprigera yunnana]|nr:hypothetical protein FQA39_LY04259 [Lamprigera yunnana]
MGRNRTLFRQSCKELKQPNPRKIEVRQIQNIGLEEIPEIIVPELNNALNKLKRNMAAGPGLSEATVHVITELGSVTVEYFFSRVFGNVKGNDCGTVPNGSGIRERQCVGTL